MAEKINPRTYERAWKAAQRIYEQNKDTEGACWWIHRGWLAGFKAGQEAAKRRAKR